MEILVAPQEVEVQSVDRRSIAMELLDRYGTSLFVDAVEASRFDRTFQKRLYFPLGDDLFWDDVKTKLKESTSAKV